MRRLAICLPTDRQADSLPPRTARTRTPRTVARLACRNRKRTGRRHDGRAHREERATDGTGAHGAQAATDRRADGADAPQAAHGARSDEPRARLRLSIIRQRTRREVHAPCRWTGRRLDGLQGRFRRVCVQNRQARDERLPRVTGTRATVERTARIIGAQAATIRRTDGLRAIGGALPSRRRTGRRHDGAPWLRVTGGAHGCAACACRDGRRRPSEAGRRRGSRALPVVDGCACRDRQHTGRARLRLSRSAAHRPRTVARDRRRVARKRTPDGLPVETVGTRQKKKFPNRRTNPL